MTSELKTTTNENHDDSQSSPPPYRSVIDKLENYNRHSPLPPSYSDVTSPSVVYINNYPEPPLSDGVLQITTANIHSFNSDLAGEGFFSKKMRIYLGINGIITIFFGLMAIGLQIGLLVSHSIVYYYYGFWAGILIITTGLSTIVCNNRYHTYDSAKFVRSFICQTIFIAIVFGFGLIIVLTDTCDDDAVSQNDGNDDACKRSYKILNGFLLTAIALTLVQSIFNTCIIGCLKRRYSNNSNSFS